MNFEVFDFQIRSVCAKEIKISFYKLTYYLYYIVAYDHFCGSSLNLFSISSNLFSAVFESTTKQMFKSSSIAFVFSGHI